MAFAFKELIKGISAKASDGDAGKIKDILFDDQSFKIRYFVLDTAKWLPGHKVLLSPDSLRRLDFKEGTATFSLTREKIEGAPSLESDLPVSRQHEQLLHNYYGWTPYWTDPLVGGAWFPYPGYTWPAAKTGDLGNYPEEWTAINEMRKEKFDQNLRSVDEICGYRISSKDDQEFGEVSDAIFDDEGGILVDLVLSSRKWLPGGKQFTCSPLFVTDIDETDRRLSVSMTKDTLMNTPEYESKAYGKEHRESVVQYYIDSRHQGVEAGQKVPSSDPNIKSVL